MQVTTEGIIAGAVLLAGRIIWVKSRDALRAGRRRVGVNSFIADSLAVRFAIHTTDSTEPIDLMTDTGTRLAQFRLTTDKAGYGMVLAVNSGGGYSPRSDIIALQPGVATLLTDRGKATFDLPSANVCGGGRYFCAIAAEHRESLQRLDMWNGLGRSDALAGKGAFQPE